jgi:adenine-specific DNA-methyltransferase
VYRVDRKGAGASSSVSSDLAGDEGWVLEEENGESFALEADEVTSAFVHTSQKALKPKQATSSQPKHVLSYRHTETRVNNPEVGMVHPDNDPDQPKTVWRYDPHLDPELMFDSQRGAVERLIDDALASGDADTMRDALVELKRLQEPYLNWAGKAEGSSFAVDTVSLHVHERVDPATILANARKRLRGGEGLEAWRQAELFAAAFENLPLRQALDFYQHEKGWSNRLIAGDSLLVMNSLLRKESMAGKVQMIYIDPPYGIKYGSNFQPFVNRKPDASVDKDEDLTQEPEMIKAFRDTWELEIHSYLTYLRDRVLLAKELLTDNGSLFIQISDENLNFVKDLVSEIFGPENFKSIITVRKTTTPRVKNLDSAFFYIVWFSKDAIKCKVNTLYVDKPAAEWVRDTKGGSWGVIDGCKRRPLEPGEKQKIHLLPATSEVYCLSKVTSSGESGSPRPWKVFGTSHAAGAGSHWKSHPQGMDRLVKAGRVEDRGRPWFIRKHSDLPVKRLNNLFDDTAGKSGETVYVVQTKEEVIARCLLLTTDPADLVLDPTCGSGTTAYVAEKWGRRWITCDTSRVAVTLAKQRLMTASFDYFRLRHPHDGLRGGFDYKSVSYVTLESIANNPDVDSIYASKHPEVVTALDELNDVLRRNFRGSFVPSQGYRRGRRLMFATESLEEWEVPFDCPHDWQGDVRSAFDRFDVSRGAMQVAMDKAVQSNAQPVPLYDEPELDKSRLRITGPFSVEAVPAPTVMSLDESAPLEQADTTVARSGETSRQTQWRDELIRTGIRAKGGAMLKFTDLEAIPGVKHLHASGTLDSGERVVVSFGPAHAALEQKQVERAIEDAQVLVPKPKFVVFCAFTFDPEAAKDIDELNWPGVMLLKAQMNTDLLTEDLKKARSSNQSFWLMGQPEVESKKIGDNWQVEVHGFDYFDPREGTLVSGGKSKIAMWSLDTDYDGRSLMPHQVFFPMAGAKDGWNRLKKTIRAELDEDLLEQFHGTVSLPFKAGDHRRVAVKIVDDRGIESLKIINLE